MEAISAPLALCEGNPPVTGGVPSQRARNAGFEVFFDVRLKKRLNKQSSRRWFQMTRCSLWRHCSLYFIGAVAIMQLLQSYWINPEKYGATNYTIQLKSFIMNKNKQASTLQWRHNEHDGVSNHQLPDCLLNSLCRRKSKKTTELPVTGRCAGNPTVTGGFPPQRVSNAENVSSWWRHHETLGTFHECIMFLTVYSMKYAIILWLVF